MPLNKATVSQRKSAFLHILSYRIPMPVVEVLLFSNGDSYPICPRCDEPTDREYMQFCDQCGQRLNWDGFDRATIIHAPRRKRLDNTHSE
jgi:predicted amidophosphoribosyltransferase